LAQEVSSAKPIPNLTSGRLLARNTIWNLLGQMLPMAVAVVAIPPLVRALGVARFGVLSLAWIVVGYFSLFELGIGRALTKLVADKLGANEEHSIPPLAWTSLLLMFLLGALGGLVAFTISPWLVHRALKVPLELQAETLRGFYLLALSIPIVITTSGLRSILEAQQRFRILNLIRIPLSIFSVAGPPQLIARLFHSVVLDV
jgi:O-antigen/teichoic acid export membrane protein